MTEHNEIKNLIGDIPFGIRERINPDPNAGKDVISFTSNEYGVIGDLRSRVWLSKMINESEEVLKYGKIDDNVNKEYINIRLNNYIKNIELKLSQLKDIKKLVNK